MLGTDCLRETQTPEFFIFFTETSPRLLIGKSPSMRFDPDEILEILGPGGDLFGYIIFASGDSVKAKAAEANTVRLYYNPKRAPEAKVFL